MLRGSFPYRSADQFQRCDMGTTQTWNEPRRGSIGAPAICSARPLVFVPSTERARIGAYVARYRLPAPLTHLATDRPLGTNLAGNAGKVIPLAIGNVPVSVSTSPARLSNEPRCTLTHLAAANAARANLRTLSNGPRCSRHLTKVSRKSDNIER